MSFTPIGRTAQTQVERNHIRAGRNAGNHTSVATANNLPEIAAWLAGQVPEDMDKAAVSRASQHGVELQIRYEGRFPSCPNGERISSYLVAVGCEIGGNIDNALAAADDLRKFNTPAPIREIEGWLAELSVISAKRQDDGFTEGLRLTAYASRLSQYPADVARHCVLVRTWKFWPTWDELKSACDAMAGPRNHMIYALENPPAPEPVTRPPTQGERDRIQVLVDDMFPNIPKEQRAKAVEEVTKEILPVHEGLGPNELQAEYGGAK